MPLALGTDHIDNRPRNRLRLMWVSVWMGAWLMWVAVWMGRYMAEVGLWWEAKAES